MLAAPALAAPPKTAVPPPQPFPPLPAWPFPGPPPEGWPTPAPHPDLLPASGESGGNAGGAASSEEFAATDDTIVAGQLTQSEQPVAPQKLTLGGYVDFGFFATQGNGAGFTQDVL